MNAGTEPPDHERRCDLQREPSNGEHVLVKRASDKRGGQSIEREFRAFEAARSVACLTPLRLEHRRDGVAALYADFPGIPLPSATGGRRLEADAFEIVAKAACAALAAFHEAGFCLVGVAPGSFLVDGPTLKLCDATLAQPVAAALTATADSWVESPFLPYLAPEVLRGRGGPPGVGADLYALGAVLYELLAGRPPFTGPDAAAIIQGHLAREPEPLNTARPDVPRRAIRAVNRLLAKESEDRFADTGAFLGELAGDEGLLPPEATRGHVRDILARLGRPEPTLHGRDAAVRVLSDGARANRTAPAVIFVEGEAGLGKTSVVRQVLGGPRMGLAAGGAFQQGGALVPLSGWAGVLRELGTTILASSSAALAGWRRDVITAVGDSWTLLAALAPEWAAVLRGAARQSHELDPRQERLAVAIHRLLACFGRREAPLVVYLEDLQWADSSSLRILEVILTLPEPLGVLVVGTVRTSIEEPDPIAATRQSMAAAGVEARSIRLMPWGKDEMQAFLEDTFRGRLVDGDTLGALVLAKTHGNPFFARQWLTALIQRGGVHFEAGDAAWHLRPEATHGVPIADNVVTFLAKRIADQAPDCARILQEASCLGRRFRLSDLLAISDLAEATQGAALEQLTGEGLLIETTRAPRSGEAAETWYEFAHDRILEAARPAAADQDAALHLQAARRLLASTEGAATLRVTEIAGYYNRAAALVTDASERHRAAAFDLDAGRSARRRGAFSQSFELFRAGIGFLEAPGGEERGGPSIPMEAAWRERPELTRALFEGAAEGALLTGDIEGAFRLCDELLRHLSSPLDRAPVYGIRIGGLNAQKRFSQAVDAALEILGELGVRFPEEPSTLRIAAGYLATRRRLLARSVNGIAALPEMKDPVVKAAAKIVQSIFSAAYLGRPRLFPLLVYRHVLDSLAYGNEDYSAATYAAFAVVLCAMGDVDNGTRLGEVAVGMLERFEADHLKARVLMSHGMFVLAWKRHLADVLPLCEAGGAAGLAHGDFEYAAYLITVRSLARLQSGAPLADLASEFEESWQKVRSLGQERSELLQALLWQTVLDLRGESTRSPLGGPAYTESTSLPRCLEPLDENLAFHHFHNKLIVSVFLDKRSAALEAAVEGRRYLAGGAFGNYLGAVFEFYESIAILSGSTRSPLGFRERRRVASNQRRMKKRARSGPANFANKFALVEAERCRRASRSGDAQLLYEQAIVHALEQGFVHEASLAQERAATFYLERDLFRLGRAHLREAYEGYASWGAVAVTERLSFTHSQQLALIGAEQESSRTSARPRGVSGLDYRMLLKSSQALSGEVYLPQLVERLLQTLMAHVGAQRGLLLLDRRGALYVEAEASVDREGVERLDDETIEDTDRLCRAIAYYVARTETPLILDDASNAGAFAADPYVLARRTRAVMCSPILYQGRLLGLTYLENNRISHAFTASRLEVVNLLAGQAAISIANARFHELRLEAQQARIKPHFLFNSLSSIADLTLQDSARAESAIIKLANLYRYILTSTAGDLVSLEQELEITRSYLELEQLRFGDRLQFSLEVDGDLSSILVPGLLVQPLVENSVRYAVSPRLAGGRVWVHASVRGGRCSLVVQDDGDGGKPGSGGTGFGLKSVTERLSLAYGEGYSFSITTTGGYRVEIDIPVANPRSD